MQKNKIAGLRSRTGNNPDKPDGLTKEGGKDVDFQEFIKNELRECSPYEKAYIEWRSTHLDKANDLRQIICKFKRDCHLSTAQMIGLFQMMEKLIVFMA